MKQHIALVAILAASSLAAAETKPYTLADLKTLVSQKAYQEAVTHLGDIGPSERNAEWLDLAATSAAGLLATMSTAQTVYAIDELDRLYPQIIPVAKYNKVRAELGVKGYEKCLGGGEGGCLEQASKFLDADPTNVDLALKLAKVVRRSFSSSYTAAPFFKRAAAGKGAAAACKDNDLRISLVAALGLPKSYDAAAAGRSLADTCWADHKKTVIDAFNDSAKSGSSYVRINTCEILKAKKALTVDQSRVCAKDKDDD